MKKIALALTLLALPVIAHSGDLVVDRIQIVIGNKETTIDYTLTDANGKQIADGTLANFTPSQAEAILEECKAKVLELFETKYIVQLDAKEELVTIVKAPTETYKVVFESDTK